MHRLSTGLHLVQSPLYRGKNTPWNKNILDVISGSVSENNWDPTAFLSFNSFNYVCGDRTLFQQVRRQPWLSSITEEGDVTLNSIPQHGRLWKSFDEIADVFIELLCEEAEMVCRNRKDIYILLSGGLDSRVIAGILSKLRREERIMGEITAVTWGRDNCRDVVYARDTADVLGINWHHIDFKPEHVVENVELTARYLGGLISPNHLHRMGWFKQVDPDALVLAGSYGDSIGRAEFSGNHLLQLKHLQPSNPFGLIREEVFAYAHKQLQEDLVALHQRAYQQPEYAVCEHEQQGYYMRGLINHAMSLIDHYCDSYQIFTSPSVYSYMWSLHPSLRGDEVYALALERLDSQLARVPWARTNRALRGKTLRAQSGLHTSFQDYNNWVGGPVFAELSHLIDPDWFAETNIFDPEKVLWLNQMVKNSKAKKTASISMIFERWLWLASVRRFAEHVQLSGKKIAPPIINYEEISFLRMPNKKSNEKWVQSILGKLPFIVDLHRKLRKFRLMRRAKKLRKQSIKLYPPE